MGNALETANSALRIESYRGVTRTAFPGLLLSLRVVSFQLTGFICCVTFIVLDWTFFLYLSFWEVLLAFGFYALVLISYILPGLEPGVYLLYETVLGLGVVITVEFWTVVYPFLYLDREELTYPVVIHGGVLVLLLLDYLLNQIRIIQTHYLLLVACLLLYGALNVPYTLTHKPLYPRITYTNILTYLVILYTFALGYFAFRFFMWTDQVLKRTEDYQELLE